MGRDNKRRGSEGGRGGGGGGGKKHKYIPKAPGSGQAMPPNTRGILVTCDSHWERKAGDEALQIIEEHYTKLAPGAEEAAAPETSSGAKDFSALIAAEVAALKDSSKKRFLVHETGVKGTVFIKFPEEPVFPGPQEVVVSICTEVKEQKVSRGRHVQRFLPADRTCYASLDEIRRVARQLLGAHFGELNELPAEEDENKEEEAAEKEAEAGEKETTEEKQDKAEEKAEGEEKKEEAAEKVEVEVEKVEAEKETAPAADVPAAASADVPATAAAAEGASAITGGLSFAVEYEHRAADSFDRLDVINAFTDLIKVPPHKVQLTNPDKTILVQITRNSCAVAVVGSYKALQKFNIRKLAEIPEDAA